MTIRDYIAAYNKTFGYVEQKFGTEALADLFNTISDEYCVHLDEYIREYGVEGCMKYWGGDDGTLSREKIDFKVWMEGDVFHGRIQNCTSVADVRSRGQEPYTGNLTYCDHCDVLYGNVAKKYNIELRFIPEYNDDGTCVGNCTWYAKRLFLKGEEKRYESNCEHDGYQRR